MEYVIMILEFLSKFGSGLSVTALLSILIGILIYMIDDDKKFREHTDDQFEALKTRQDEMTEEYKEGFEKIRQELALQKEALNALQGQQKENQQMTLRSIVTNKDLPLEYRMINYDIYKDNGGNSWLDKYVEENLKNGDN